MSSRRQSLHLRGGNANDNNRVISIIILTHCYQCDNSCAAPIGNGRPVELTYLRGMERLSKSSKRLGAMRELSPRVRDMIVPLCDNSRIAHPRFEDWLSRSIPRR